MTFTKMLRHFKLADKATAHGFRSSFRDWATEHDQVREVVAEAALAHAVKDKTEAAYRIVEQLEEIVRKVQAEKVSEPIMVGASKAHRIIGVSRTQFYNFRKKYPSLEALAFMPGDGDKVYWLVEDLRAWVREVRDAQAGSGGSLDDPSDEVSSAGSLDEAA